jgi:ribosome-associated protein
MIKPEVASEKISKSERKRQMLLLQKLGETLVTLSDAQLKAIPLEKILLTAIHDARKINSHEAKRRQLQYIGRLMRDLNPDPIREAIDKIQLKSNQSKAALQRIERWRDRLIHEDDSALREFLQTFPSSDHQQLRQLIQNAKKEMKGADTLLFRYLRNIITSST